MNQLKRRICTKESFQLWQVVKPAALNYWLIYFPIPKLTR